MYRGIDIGPCSLIAKEYKYMAFRESLGHQLESGQVSLNILHWSNFDDVTKVYFKPIT